jgi:DnaJ-class molecular chaperone
MTYRQLMRHYHPDNSEKHGWDEETKERNIGITKKINAAYELITSHEAGAAPGPHRG